MVIAVSVAVHQHSVLSVHSTSSGPVTLPMETPGSGGCSSSVVSTLSSQLTCL